MGDFNKIDGVYAMPLGEHTVYLSNRVTNGVKAGYEDWMEETARKRPYELRRQGKLSEAEFRDSLRATTEACATHTLAWGGEAWKVSLTQMPGIVQLIVLLANSRKVKELYPAQKVDAEVITGMLASKEAGEAIVQAVDSILHATPNFPSPPRREMVTEE